MPKTQGQQVPWPELEPNLKGAQGVRSLLEEDEDMGL